MEKFLLYNFFKGNVSLKEGLKVKAWVEASKENERTFYKERKIFDALVLHTPPMNSPTYILKLLPGKRIMRAGWLKIASTVILTLTFTYLFQEYKASHEPLEMTTISVPEGQRANITLPDGTNVWLNARTTLQYPSSFNKQKRMVVLKGEAYFDVKRNEAKVFVVQTDVYNVEVLGTKFNVSAYPGFGKFETTLMHGSVKVIPHADSLKEVTLVPDHKIVLEAGKLKVMEVNDYNPYRWKEGLICFSEESFLNIMHDFEKYYGIKVVIENKSVLEYKFTGKFRQSDGVDYALRILQNNINFKYDKDIEKQLIYIR